MDSPLLVLAVASITLLYINGALCWTSNDPTSGFVELPLNSSNFVIHKPYNLPVSARYRFTRGIHRLWVFSTDKPLSLTSNTSARSEIRIHVNNPLALNLFMLISLSLLLMQLTHD